MCCIAVFSNTRNQVIWVWRRLFVSVLRCVIFECASARYLKHSQNYNIVYSLCILHMLCMYHYCQGGLLELKRLVSQSIINQQNIIQHSNNWLNVSDVPKIHWFQPLICEDLMFFCLIVGFEYGTSTVVWYFIDKKWLIKKITGRYFDNENNTVGGSKLSIELIVIIKIQYKKEQKLI